jgi:hypothetical protein
VEAVDDDAFIIEFDVNNVKGGVLRKFLSKKQSKRLSEELIKEKKIVQS